MTSKEIDWKIFQLQSQLINDEANFTPELLMEAKIWFQPQNYHDIIEERANSGKCGYPICDCQITIPNTNIQQYRIDYKRKQIFSVDESKFYCSTKCLEESLLYKTSLDTSNPFIRPAVKNLLKHSVTINHSTNDNSNSSNNANGSNNNRLSNVDEVFHVFGINTISNQSNIIEETKPITLSSSSIKQLPLHTSNQDAESRNIAWEAQGEQSLSINLPEPPPYTNQILSKTGKIINPLQPTSKSHIQSSTTTIVSTTAPPRRINQTSMNRRTAQSKLKSSSLSSSSVMVMKESIIEKENPIVQSIIDLQGKYESKEFLVGNDKNSSYHSNSNSKEEQEEVIITSSMMNKNAISEETLHPSLRPIIWPSSLHSKSKPINIEHENTIAKVSPLIESLVNTSNHLNRQDINTPYDSSYIKPPSKSILELLQSSSQTKPPSEWKEPKYTEKAVGNKVYKSRNSGVNINKNNNGNNNNNKDSSNHYNEDKFTSEDRELYPEWFSNNDEGSEITFHQLSLSDNPPPLIEETSVSRISKVISLDKYTDKSK